MFSTPARKAVGVVAGGAWAAGGVVLARLETAPAHMAQPQELALLLLAVVVAATCSLGLVLRVRNDCVERAFELGYRAGMCDGIKVGRGAGRPVVELPRPRATSLN